MSYSSEKRAYATQAKAHLTLAEAARQLEISRQTLLKWAECGHIAIETFGPAQQPIRRVPITEVNRLKKIA